MARFSLRTGSRAHAISSYPSGGGFVLDVLILGMMMLTSSGFLRRYENTNHNIGQGRASSEGKHLDDSDLS